MIEVEFVSQSLLYGLIPGLSQHGGEFAQGIAALFGSVLFTDWLDKMPGSSQLFGKHTKLVNNFFVFESLRLFEIGKSSFDQLDTDVGKSGHSFN